MGRQKARLPIGQESRDESAMRRELAWEIAGSRTDPCVGERGGRTLLSKDLGIAEEADVVAKPALHVSSLVKTAFQQHLDPLLRGRSSDRGEAHVPLRRDLEVRRQARYVDEALGLADRLLVELCVSGRDRLDERLDVGLPEPAVPTT